MALQTTCLPQACQIQQQLPRLPLSSLGMMHGLHNRLMSVLRLKRPTSSGSNRCALQLQEINVHMATESRLLVLIFATTPV